MNIEPQDLSHIDFLALLQLLGGDRPFAFSVQDLFHGVIGAAWSPRATEQTLVPRNATDLAPRSNYVSSNSRYVGPSSLFPFKRVVSVLDPQNSPLTSATYYPTIRPYRHFLIV